MRGDNLLKGTGTVLAGLLLLLLASSAWAATATDCSTCHGANIAQAHHDANDPNSDFSQGNCGACHVGITTGNDCAACHTSTGFNNKHHVGIPADTRCAECHVSAATPTLPADDPQVCALCHTGDALPKPIRTFHHTKLTAPIYYKNGKLNCAGCHTGAELTSACNTCHVHSDPFINRAKHHEGGNLACSSCHTQILVVQNCQSCHPAGSKRDFHHDYAGDNRFNCSGCHASLSPTGEGADCSRCHAPGNNRDFHHDTVKTAKNLSCGDCHTGADGSGGSGCAACHTGGNQPEHHATPQYLAGNCNACHASTGLAEPGCHSCHHFKLSDPLWQEHAHHDFVRVAMTYSLGCSDCHTFAGSSMPAPMDVDNCVFCHERVVAPKQGVPANLQPKHHVLAPVTAGNCALCHAGSKSVTDCAGCHIGGTTPDAVAIHHAGDDYAAGNCATCHTGISGGQECSACHTAAPGSTVVSRHHDQYAPNRQLACADCHTGSQAIFQSCGLGGCHAPTGTPISERHHNMTVQAQTQDCVFCHTGVDQTPVKDCAGCHVGPGKPPIAQQHHQTDLYLTGNCAECHFNTAPANIDCAGCHAGNSLERHHNKFVTINNTVQPKPCADCHQVQLAGNSCAGCHTAPIPQIHHGDPLTALGGNCGACHQSINDPKVCGSCHTSSPHHTTTWSQTGDCAHCHTVPTWAADRPAQAACRECHGSTMHDKGGPIQNFGACAACHTTIPYHPAPASIPGYTGYGAGKKKFNIFWSKYAVKEGPGERLRPNGEDMNDKGGYKIKAQQLSFSTKQITSNGKTYTVPYFTGMPIVNLALGKTATASRSESGYGPALAVDGNTSTRWWAKSTSAQTLTVDLGALKRVAKVTLRWHSYYARAYEVLVSTDNRNWTRVVDRSSSSGGAETFTFSSRDARYVRVNCKTASSSNGYSLFEFEVYAP